MDKLDKDFLDALEVIVGLDGLVCDAGELLTYETDGLVKLRSKPGVAVLPTSTLQVQAVVRLCHESGVPFVARGQGTGLSGGAMPHPDGVLIVLTRMNRICEIDLPNRCITVEPGVMNLVGTVLIKQFEAVFHYREGEFVPGYLVPGKHADLKAFHPG